MEEAYIVRSKIFLNERNSFNLFNVIFGGKYDLGVATWHEGRSLEENGWQYPLKSARKLSVKNLDDLKRAGLTLLLTRNQVARVLSKELNIQDYPIEIIDLTKKDTRTGK